MDFQRKGQYHDVRPEYFCGPSRWRRPVRYHLKKALAGISGPVDEWARAVYELIPPSLRYGKAYGEALALFEKNDRSPEEAVAAYQDRMLTRLMKHCYDNVPYYREVFDGEGLKPHDLQTAADLPKLPFLTKETVRTRRKDLIATNMASRDRVPVSTSGSTGSPLQFYIDRATRAMERALALRRLLWLGYENGDVVAVIRADTFSNRERLYRYFHGSRELVFDFTSADDEKLEKIVQTLEKFRPAFIRALPWSIYILARWMERNRRQAPPLKYIVTASENLRASMKEQVERVFKARVVDHYGQNEQVAYAFQCGRGEAYHIQREMSVVELVPSGGGESEIVGTCLHNLAMPFVRYRTGDLAVEGGASCPCGRNGPVLSDIKGREVEVIITPEKKIVAPGPLDFAFYGLEEIREGQIVQEDIDRLVVKLVPWETISQGTRDNLIKQLGSYLKSPLMNIVVEEVREIPRTRSGKKLFVVSNLRVDDYLQGAS